MLRIKKKLISISCFTHKTAISMLQAKTEIAIQFAADGVGRPRAHVLGVDVGRPRLVERRRRRRQQQQRRPRRAGERRRRGGTPPVQRGKRRFRIWCCCRRLDGALAALQLGCCTGERVIRRTVIRRPFVIGCVGLDRRRQTGPGLSSEFQVTLEPACKVHVLSNEN